MTSNAYNPLEKLNLGRNVVEAMLATPVRSLDDTDGLLGAGIYALYYVGSLALYRPIAEANTRGRFSLPIYVGKAIPKGGRKGGMTHQAASVSTSLRSRLKQHAESVRQCHNLEVHDFSYRALVVDDIWIPLGENMLIEMFKPVWNRVIDGFGNKDPGMRRKDQYKSPWDVLHPGREFADKLANGPETAAKLKKKVALFFAGDLSAMLDDDTSVGAADD